MGFLDSLWGLYPAVAPAVFQAAEHKENDGVYSAHGAVLGEVTDCHLNLAGAPCSSLRAHWLESHIFTFSCCHLKK